MEQPASPPTETVDSFSVLPNEMVEAVLRQLNLPDLINCRSVSVRFLNATSRLFRELLIYGVPDPNGYSIGITANDQRDFRFRMPNLSNLLQQSNTSLFTKPSFKKIYANLRYLAVSIPIQNPLDLNHFSDLERLYAKRLALDGPTDLTLPKLKLLVVEFLMVEPTKEPAILMVHSKVLEELICRPAHRVWSLHSDSLKHLAWLDFDTYNMFDYSMISKKYRKEDIEYPKLAANSRIQTLKIELPKIPVDFDNVMALILSSEYLTELHFDWNFLIRSTDLSDKLPQRIWAKKPHLKIFLAGVQVTKENQVALAGLSMRRMEDVLQMQIDHYQHLNGRPEDYPTIYYNRLPVHLFDNFFIKFRKARCIRGHAIIHDSDQFVRLVNSCKDLNWLEFNISGLKQSDCDRLSLNRLSMHRLILRGENSDVDYCWIRKLDYLWTLCIDQPMQCDTVISLFTECQQLMVLDSNVGDQRILTFRTKKGSKKDSTKDIDTFFVRDSPSFDRWQALRFSDWTEFREHIATHCNQSESSLIKRLKMGEADKFHCMPL